MKKISRYLLGLLCLFSITLFHPSSTAQAASSIDSETHLNAYWSNPDTTEFREDKNENNSNVVLNFNKSVVNTGDIYGVRLTTRGNDSTWGCFFINDDTSENDFHTWGPNSWAEITSKKVPGTKDLYTTTYTEKKPLFKKGGENCAVNIVQWDVIQAKYDMKVYDVELLGKNGKVLYQLRVPHFGQSEATAYIGSTLKLDFYNTNTSDKITWKSSKTKVATVKNGVVTPVKAGTTTITASVNGQAYTCTVTVKAPELNKKSITLPAGGSFTLVANGFTAKSYTSSKKSVATISNKGVIKAVKAGSAKMTVTDKKGKKYTCNVTVTDPMTYESAQDALDNMIVGANITNTLDSYKYETISDKSFNISDETVWGQPIITRDMIKAFKSAGFNAIRLPVTWFDHTDSKGNITPEWLDRVQTVVDYILAEDMYCIINIHHDTGSNNGIDPNEAGWILATPDNYKKNSKKVASMWKQIAEKFMNYPEKLVFEGFNEMIGKHRQWEAFTSEQIDTMNKWNQLFVDTVRSTGAGNTARNLICNVIGASVEENPLQGYKLPADTVEGHLIAEVHCYEPWDFADPHTYLDKDSIPFTEEHVAVIDEWVANLDKYLTSQGIPTILGEFGAWGYDDAENAKYYGYVLSELKAKGVPGFTWDSDIVNRRTYKIDRPQTMDAIKKATQK